MKRRVVITGMGAITPIGNTVEENWKSIKEGHCGIAPITLFDTADFKVKIAGEVKDFKPENWIDKKEASRMDRFTQFGIIAATEAMENSGLSMADLDTTRFGVLFSSGIGGLKTIEDGYARGEKKGFDHISPFFIPMSITNIAAAHIAIKYGLEGMCSCPVTACASSTNAIGDGFRQIRDGYQDFFLCGGSEASITRLGLGGFTALRALSSSNDPARASIPFDAERSGFVMGEGAGALVLEEYEHAVARNAVIYGEIVGYGATCDAYHITSPIPGGTGAARSMSLALADAALSPEKIDYVNAHGTSTPVNDREETSALRLTFGDHAEKLAISSTKSYTGHLLGASGAVEAIYSALALKSSYLPATIHYETADPDCDLDIIPNVGREAGCTYAMSNSFGFGGHNATIILKKWEA